MKCPTCKGSGEVKEHSFDFERLFTMYPHRMNQNKKAGLKRLNSSVLTLEHYAKFEQAILNYAKYVKLSRVEERFVKSFGTFCTSWDEWVTLVPAKTKTLCQAPAYGQSPPYNIKPDPRDAPMSEETKALLNKALKRPT